MVTFSREYDKEESDISSQSDEERGEKTEVRRLVQKVQNMKKEISRLSTVIGRKNKDDQKERWRDGKQGERNETENK